MAVKKTLFYLSIVFSISVSSPSFSGDASDIYKKTKNSIFVVFAKNVDDQVISQGSAVAISENKLVTNWHVVSEASSVVVSSSGIEFSVDIEGKIKNLDLAVLYQNNHKLSAVKIQMDAPQEGEKVFAIGAPLGLDKTISEGIISSIRKDKENTIYQITAPISPGSSGGGVFNTKGELLGVTTSQLKYGQNLNFAIPVKYLSNEFDKNQSQEDITNARAFEAARDDYLLRPTIHAMKSLAIVDINENRAILLDIDSIAVSGNMVVFDKFIRWEKNEGGNPPPGSQMISHTMLDCQTRMIKTLGALTGSAYSSSAPKKLPITVKFEWEPILSSDETKNWMIDLCKNTNNLRKAKGEIFMLHMNNIMRSPMFVYSVADMILPTKFTKEGKIAEFDFTTLRKFWLENSVYSKSP